jgi:hypothetical protein
MKPFVPLISIVAAVAHIKDIFLFFVLKYYSSFFGIPYCLYGHCLIFCMWPEPHEPFVSLISIRRLCLVEVAKRYLPTIPGNHLNSIWMWGALPCAWSHNCSCWSWWLLGVCQLQHGFDRWGLHISIFYFSCLLHVGGGQGTLLVLVKNAYDGMAIFITFLSPLRGSPSSTVASRMTPQSYFLL